MSDYIVKDNNKKKMMMMITSKKLWRNFVSTFHSKFNSLRRSQSRKTTCRFTGAISCPQRCHHHHDGQTINNYYHYHYYCYHPDQTSDLDQKQPDVEKSLFVDNKAYNMEPCSEVPTSSTVTNAGQHVRTITPDMEFFDANSDGDEDDKTESLSGAVVSADGCGGDSSNYITFSRAQLLEVDARAEEFINERKQAWRLEKQKSEEEYWQMLARGT